VQTLRFVAAPATWGFSVEGIGELLALWRDPLAPERRRQAPGHRAGRGLRRRIREMEEMARTLQTPGECCAGDDRPDCPILRDMETSETSPPRSHRTRRGFGSSAKVKPTRADAPSV
jgi:MerR family gold-responsive transcriptional activator of gol and ges genes